MQILGRSIAFYKVAVLFGEILKKKYKTINGFSESLKQWECPSKKNFKMRKLQVSKHCIYYKLYVWIPNTNYNVNVVGFVGYHYM